MSDFDKEAERRKLREKYEQDQQKRESTQRMSELLLQGATMTNRHCDNCGDPIFRYDGQEFCPSCQNAQVVDGQATGDAQSADAEASASTAAGADATEAGSVGADASGAGENDAAEAESVDVQTPDDGARSAASHADEETSADRGASAAGADTHASTPAGTANATVDAGTNAAGHARTNAAARNATDAPTEGTTASSPEASGGSSRSEARASLERTVAEYARAAEQADDPRQARELLATAREAAEALTTLEQ